MPHPTSCPSPGRLRFRLTFSLTASSPAPMLGHPTITVFLPVIAQPHGGCLAPHFRSGRLRAQRWFSTWALRVAPSYAAGTSADDPGTAVVHKQQVAAAELPTLEDTRKRPSGASAGEPGEPSIHRRASNYEKRAYMYRVYPAPRPSSSVRAHGVLSACWTRALVDLRPISMLSERGVRAFLHSSELK